MQRPLSLITMVALLLVAYVSFNLVRPTWLLPVILWGTAPFFFLDLCSRRGWVATKVALPLSICALSVSAWMYLDRLFVHVSSLNSNVLVIVPTAQLAIVAFVLIVRMAWLRRGRDSET